MTAPYENWRPFFTSKLCNAFTEDQVKGILGILEPQLAAWAEYESVINWHTTCTSCARILDSAYKETVRAEKAEQALEQYEESVVGDLNEKNIRLARRVAALEGEVERLEAIRQLHLESDKSTDAEIKRLRERLDELEGDDEEEDEDEE